MLIERLLENLAVDIDAFAVCDVSPGWRLQLHALDRVTLHFVLEGEGRLLTGRRRVQLLERSTLAVVPPGMPHAIEAGRPPVAHAVPEEVATHVGDLVALRAGPPGDDDLVVACGRLQATLGGGLGLFDRMHEPIVLDFRDSTRMGETFAALLEEQRTMEPGTQAMMSALMRECLVFVFRRLTDDPDCTVPWLSALDDPRLGAVVEAVLEQPEEPHSVDSLAAQALMSRSAFSQQFTVAFGRSPMAFVRDVRLRRAAAILRATDLPIGVIARRVGFASRSHFSRAFRSAFGVTPARFRTADTVATPAERALAGAD